MAQPIQTLKKRRDFLLMNSAKRWVTDGFILQYAPVEAGSARIGYTVSKKVGNAVIRNRVKRRLRSAAGAILTHEAATMVLIGRPGAQNIPFKILLKDLRWALKRLKQHVKPQP